MRLSRQIEDSLFFTKMFREYKNANQTKTNQQNKNKRTKNNRGNNFLCIKFSVRKNIGYFAL